MVVEKERVLCNNFSDLLASNNFNEKEIYLNYIRFALERAFSLLDNQTISASYGSFDRTWWCWKFTDRSAARLQEGIYTLAWTYKNFHLLDYPDWSKQRILIAIEAAIHFWVSLQHQDGSFDEAYPFERSLAASAFTGFYVSSAVQILQDVLSKDTLAVALKALDKLGIWLHENGEFHGILSNHLAAAAAAAQVIAELTGNKLFLLTRDKYLNIIYREQDKEEGWLKEYGGADPGYQSHAMFYMADIWRRTQDEILLACLQRATKFIAWFIHPDGTLGGEYASRGTKFAYPAAFEMLAHKIPEAASIAAYLKQCLARQRGVGLAQMDIWNFFPLLNNYLFAVDYCSNQSKIKHELPWRQSFSKKVFPNANLVVANVNDRLLIVGLGGTIKLWDISSCQLLYEDCGYAIKKGKNYAVSQMPAILGVEYKSNDFLSVSVSVNFSKLSTIRFNPWRFVCFRLFTLTIGRFPLTARWLKQFLVFTLIKKRKPYLEKLIRRIDFSQVGRLVIDDQLIDMAHKPLSIARNIPYHMGSARYADKVDWFGAKISCTEVVETSKGMLVRKLIIMENGSNAQ